MKFLSFFLFTVILITSVGAVGEVINLQDPITISITTGAGGVDGNASSICTLAEVLLGNNSCMDITPFLAAAGSDSNASTACTNGEVLLGNSSCMNVSDFTTSSDTINIFDQDLNTTDWVLFFGVNATNWSNITIFEEQISDLVHTTDTSAFVNCTSDEVFLGNGTCTSSAAFLTSATDTNATTECADTEVLLGNGTCMDNSDFFDNVALWDYNQTIPANTYTDQQVALDDMHLHNILNLTGTDDNACTGTNKVTNVSIVDGALSITCSADEDSGSVNIFDQDLNTTSNVIFNLLNLTSILNLDWSNVTITESQVSDLVHVVDTSASVNCTGDEVFFGNGTCTSSAPFLSSSTDTNASTECTDDEVLLGNSTCWSAANFFGANNIFDQELNTTEWVLFFGVNATNWSNITIVEAQITDLIHTVDTSAFVNCTGDSVFLGNGTCTSSSAFLTSATDTNASTECSDGEVLLGNSTCVDSDLFFGASDTINIFDQDLNTTDWVLFFGVNATNWSNITIFESQISDLVHITDTSASVNCTGDEVFFGNGTCSSSAPFLTSSTDTNASTECSSGEALLGNSTCVDTVVFFDDTNETGFIHNLASDVCIAGEQMTGVLTNGTIQCVVDADSGSVNIFDQDLNTTDWVLFFGINATNWSNITIFESQINDLTHTVDTSASVNCTGDEVFFGNGTCGSSAPFLTGTDGNASSICSSDEVLLGNTTCTSSSTFLGSENIFDQDLNTTNNVIFNLLNISGVLNLDWSNVTITESQITDLVHVVDTSASVNCTGDEVFFGNGTCTSSSTLGGGVNTWETNLTTGVTANLFPLTTLAFTLGDSSNIWATLFANNMSVNNWSNVTIVEAQVTDLSHTVDTSASVNCTSDEVFLGNGTCWSSSNFFGSNNIFDQDLNTTSNVTFDNIAVTNNLTISGDIELIEGQNITQSVCQQSHNGSCLNTFCSAILVESIGCT